MTRYQGYDIPRNIHPSKVSLPKTRVAVRIVAKYIDLACNRPGAFKFGSSPPGRREIGIGKEPEWIHVHETDLVVEIDLVKRQPGTDGLLLIIQADFASMSGLGLKYPDDGVEGRPAELIVIFIHCGYSETPAKFAIE